MGALGWIILAGVVITAVIVGWFAYDGYRAREAERHRLVQLEAIRKRVQAAPYRATMAASDGRQLFVSVRPSVGDELPTDVRDELERYVSELTSREIGKRLRLEYVAGRWQKALPK